jgi:hypothetical protein
LCALLSLERDANGEAILPSAPKALTLMPVMARKLFTVNIKTEILVLAEDEMHAETVAKHIVVDEWPCRTLQESHFAFQVQPMSHVPAGYDIDDYPEDNTLEEPERTVRELIELGAAPGYTAAHNLR